MAIGALMEVVGSHLLMEPVLACAIVATGLLMRAAAETLRVYQNQPASIAGQLESGCDRIAGSRGCLTRCSFDRFKNFLTFYYACHK
jgi:hypothetical protein